MQRTFCAALLPLLLGTTPLAAARVDHLDPNPATGASLAVVVDPVPLAHTAQFLPVDDRGEIIARGDVRRQTEAVLVRLDAALKTANSSLAEAVKLNISVARPELSAAVSAVLAQRFPGNAKPAVAFVGGTLPHPDALVAIDAVAVSRARTTGAAPVHYPGANPRRSAVSVLPPTGVVYVAGLADKSELGPATTVTLDKIVSAITHLGLQRRDIVQLKAFLRPMSRVQEAERAIAEFFGSDVGPPVVYVEWISPGTPIEIEAVVAAPTSPAERSVTYHTPPDTTRSPVYSRLARLHHGRRIYVSGLIGTSSAENDVTDIYRQLDDIITRTGSSREHLLKATYYFSDPKSNARLDAFRPGYYNKDTPPAASKAQVSHVGRPERGITIDMIAGMK